MIVVHHLENSRSQRILWLLEELGLPYEIKRYARNPKTMLAPPELLAVHPLGKSPVITDGDRVIAESGAIVEYLLEQAPGNALAPPESGDARLDYRYWMHYAEGSLMPLLVMKLVLGSVPAKTPFFVRPIAKAIDKQVNAVFIGPSLKRHIGALNMALEGKQWLVDDRITGADVLMSFPMEALCARGGNAVSQSIKDYVARFQARPAYQRALERGGPYGLLS
jgi:glutathione S-transferase